MTSPSSAPVTAASLRADLEKAYRARHIDPAASADLALSVVLPHLRALAGENERLRTELAAVRALAVAGGIKLAELERVRDAARGGKGGGEGERP